MSRLVVTDVWQEYGEQVVLERLSLVIEPRSFVALVGPSGCGKSTFLRLLLGDERPTRGTITLDGAPLPAEPGPDRGVVFQRYSVFPTSPCSAMCCSASNSGGRPPAPVSGAVRAAPPSKRLAR